MDIKASAKSFYEKCVRVWHILRKPTRKEFETIVKAAAIGILVIGALGFLIQLSMKIFVK